MNHKQIQDLLNELYEKYNCREFIKSDPISIPHLFEKKEDIEISGFLTALISWGQRNQIIKNATLLMELMDFEPYGFILSAGKNDLSSLNRFYYRTFKLPDLLFILRALKTMYEREGGMENFFSLNYLHTKSIKATLIRLFEFFKTEQHEERSMKHIANVSKGSSAKRINMFLRWMIRNDNKGVDFGLWKKIPASELYIPLDVHSGKTARELGLLKRMQNDWKAVEELTAELRKFDPVDPIKYDFALFGDGVTRR